MGFSGIRLLITAVLLTMFLANSALAEQTRAGRLVTLDNKEIAFEKITNRETIKGWWNGAAVSIPFEAVSKIILLETPKVDYSIIGNDIKTGFISLTRRSDGKTLVLSDAFLPSDCNCGYLTVTSRNPFTGEVLQSSAAIDGLLQIVFDDAPR